MRQVRAPTSDEQRASVSRCGYYLNFNLKLKILNITSAETLRNFKAFHLGGEAVLYYTYTGLNSQKSSIVKNIHKQQNTKF